MRANRFLTTASTLALTLALAPAAFGQGGIQPSAGDVVTTDNVEHLGTFKQLGDGVGARIVGNTLYTTSTTGLFIFDISDPAAPEQLGTYTMDVEFENEDVPTNGKILGISASTFGINCGSEAPGGCLNLYDVTDPASPELIKSVEGVSEHTMECVLDCTWFYGSEGAIVDARDPANAKVTEANWTEFAIEQGYEVTSVPASPHDVTEVAPGIVLTSSQPMVLLSLLPEHGGAPDHPVVIASGNNEDNRFIHSTLWPRGGKDRFLLVGGETVLGPVGNGGGPCNDEIAAFMTWKSENVFSDGSFLKGGTFNLVDEVRPYNGTYTDGGHPYDAFGCSTHWFDDHPSFRNGGIAAVSTYEHGTRLHQISPEGGITEIGYALPIGGAASAPYWAPDGQHFYSIDYQRGMDIWKYSGPTFQGPEDAAATTSGGGGGGTPAKPVEALGLSVKPGKATRKKGLRVKVTCSRACTLTGAVKAGKKTVAKASKRNVTKTTLKFKFKKKAVRKAKKLRLIVAAKAADGAGAKATRTVKLK